MKIVSCALGDCFYQEMASSEDVTAAFRHAARAVTELYRTAAQHSVASNQVAHAQGYSAALDDLVAYLSNINGEVVRVDEVVGYARARQAQLKEQHPFSVRQRPAEESNQNVSSANTSSNQDNPNPAQQQSSNQVSSTAADVWFGGGVDSRLVGFSFDPSVFMPAFAPNPVSFHPPPSIPASVEIVSNSSTHQDAENVNMSNGNGTHKRGHSETVVPWMGRDIVMRDNQGANVLDESIINRSPNSNGGPRTTRRRIMNGSEQLATNGSTGRSNSNTPKENKGHSLRRSASLKDHDMDEDV